MTIEKMIKLYPGKYICVKDCIYGYRGFDTLISEATVIKVYDSLKTAEMNRAEIWGFKDRYRDFDIVYGDLEDYVNTRKYKKREIPVDRGEKMSQNEIDQLITSITEVRDNGRNVSGRNL